MKRIASLLAIALVLSACTSVKSFSAFEAATPPDYTGPTANVADQVVACWRRLKFDPPVRALPTQI